MLDKHLSFYCQLSQCIFCHNYYCSDSTIKIAMDIDSSVLKTSIPSDKKAVQEDRLNKKHIQTLGYVQELMKENKKLKQIIDEYEQQKLHCDELHAANDTAQEKIKLIQEQYLNRADEINQTLIHKHGEEMKQIIEEKVENERCAHEKMRNMKEEIERLSRLNSSLEEALSAKAKMTSNNGQLTLQIEELKKELFQQQAYNSELKLSDQNQLAEIQALQKKLTNNKELSGSLASAKQTIKSHESKIASLENQLTEANQLLKETEKTLVASYRQKLTKSNELIGTLQGKVEQLNKELRITKNTVGEQLDLIEKVETERYMSHREIESLKQRVAELERELKALGSKKHSKESGSFKEFVAIKRELNMVQDENHQLKEKLGANRASSGKTLKSRLSLK